MIDDFGSISDYERDCMEKQLPDYFEQAAGAVLSEWQELPADAEQPVGEPPRRIARHVRV